MKEKLIIRNFGPIKDVELELGRFNVLIGEQATGKSTVAKVLAVCRYFSFIMQNDSSGLFNHFERGLELWGLSEFIKKDSFISYKCIHYTFIAQRQILVERDSQTGEPDGEYHFFSTETEAHSKEFENLIKELNIIKPKEINGYGFFDSNWKPPTSFFLNDVAAVLDNPYYGFTERGLQSLFSLGQNSIPNISNSLYNYYDKQDFISRNFIKDTIIEPLKITYKNENGKHKIKSDKHDFLSLSNAASGYQSTIPIILAVKYYLEFNKKRKTFIIEELEMNLFPSAQNEVIKFMADKILNHGNSLLITTHSPYILTSLNNLMYSYQVGQTHAKKVQKAINQKYWVNPTEVSAYMMLPNGTCEPITDKEGLLRVKKIDGISSILNEEFNNIMDIELNILHEKTN